MLLLMVTPLVFLSVWCLNENNWLTLRHYYCHYYLVFFSFFISHHHQLHSKKQLVRFFSIALILRISVVGFLVCIKFRSSFLFLNKQDHFLVIFLWSDDAVCLHLPEKLISCYSLHNHLEKNPFLLEIWTGNGTISRSKQNFSN